MTDLDWTRWPNFSEAEMRCRCGACGGALEVEPPLLDFLQAVRDRVGFVMPVTSGYRCGQHPSEARKKSGPGAHHFGLAADIACNGKTAHQMLAAAFALGVSGVGVSLRPGHSHFLHLDLWQHPVRPNVWSY